MVTTTTVTAIDKIAKAMEESVANSINNENDSKVNGRIISNLFDHKSNNEFKPKSLSNDFDLLDISDKVEAVYDDAINCPTNDGMLSLHLPNGDVKDEYTVLLAELKYGKLTPEVTADKILRLTKICYDAGIKIYQIVASILESNNVKDMKSDVLKSIIKLMLEVKIPTSTVSNQQQPVTCDTEQIAISNGSSANAFAPQLQQQPQIHQAGYNINDVINNINNSVYSPLDNAVKWLTNNVKFGGQIDKQEAINLYNIFNWQPFVAQVSQYYPVKDGNKRLWFRLPGYKFDTNLYKYAFGAFSGMYQDKRIIFLCNPNTGAFTTYLVNASDVATK